MTCKEIKDKSRTQLSGKYISVAPLSRLKLLDQSASEYSQIKMLLTLGLGPHASSSFSHLALFYVRPVGVILATLEEHVTWKYVPLSVGNAL